MKMLAVDTALGACSTAVLHGDDILAHRFEIMNRGHAERLAPMVREVMADAGLKFTSLDRLGVTTGPGTFTGQRVGIAFMRGLRIALKLPLLGITTLECMLAAALNEGGQRSAVALHDAKRDEVYCAASLNGFLVLPACMLRFDDAIDRVGDLMAGSPFAVAGTARERASAAWQALGQRARPTSIEQPDALWAARLAARAPLPVKAPQPLYLREPDARLPVSAKK